MGGKVEPAGAPFLDRTPVEVRQPAPRVAHVPGVGGTDVIRDQECCGGEAQPCEDGVGMGCEAGVAVVEREQKLVARRRDGTSDGGRELVQRLGSPPRPGERRHLPLEHSTSDARHAQLERSADAVIAQYRCAGHPTPPAPPPPADRVTTSSAAAASGQRAAGSSARQRRANAASQGGRARTSSSPSAPPPRGPPVTLSCSSTPTANLSSPGPPGDPPSRRSGAR